MPWGAGQGTGRKGVWIPHSEFCENKAKTGRGDIAILRNKASKSLVSIKRFPQKPKKAKKIGNFSAEYTKKDRGKPFLLNEKRER